MWRCPYEKIVQVVNDYGKAYEAYEDGLQIIGAQEVLLWATGCERFLKRGMIRTTV